MTFNKEKLEKYFFLPFLSLITVIVVLMSGCTSKRIYSSVFYASIYGDPESCGRYILSLKGLGNDSLEARVDYLPGHFQIERLKCDSTNYYSVDRREVLELQLKTPEFNSILDSIGKRRIRFYDSNNSLFCFKNLRLILDSGDSTITIGIINTSIFIPNRFSHLAIYHPVYKKLYEMNFDDTVQDYQFQLNRPASEELWNYFAIEELRVLKVIDKKHFLIQWRTLDGKEFKDVFESN